MEKRRTFLVVTGLLAMSLLGCLCQPSSVGLACSDATPCYNGVCDLSFDGGYCTIPCNAPVGDYCELTGDQSFGVCGLPLFDGGMACAQECPLDGGRAAGLKPCRPGLRCVPPPGMCSPMAYFGCPIGGVCVP